MESHQLINKLDSSKGSIKELALKYDAGKIKGDKYGEATLSGHLLYATHEEVPVKDLNQIKENAIIWLNKMGLGKYQKPLIEQQRIHLMLAYCAADTDPDKLEVMFSVLIFGTMIDDAVSKLNELNENNVIKHQQDLLSYAENLKLILESHGDKEVTEAVISKLGPLFKFTCQALSFICSRSYEQMEEHLYKRFAKELFHYIMVRKWLSEYHNFPYKKNEFLSLRSIDIFVSQPLYLLFFIKNIRVSTQITTHPVFQRYYKNAILHMILVNDILSLPKEVSESDNDNFNVVLLDCEKYSLQESIYKTEKETNELIVDLKKDKMLLETYFPANEGLNNFIKTVEYMINGAINWYVQTARYCDVKYESLVVEYGCDYNSWLETLNSMNTNYMKDPELSFDLNSTTIPSFCS